MIPPNPTGSQNSFQSRSVSRMGLKAQNSQPKKPKTSRKPRLRQTTLSRSGQVNHPACWVGVMERPPYAAVERDSSPAAAAAELQPRNRLMPPRSGAAVGSADALLVHLLASP